MLLSLDDSTTTQTGAYIEATETAFPDIGGGPASQTVASTRYVRRLRRKAGLGEFYRSFNTHQSG